MYITLKKSHFLLFHHKIKFFKYIIINNKYIILKMNYVRACKLRFSLYSNNSLRIEIWDILEDILLIELTEPCKELDLSNYESDQQDVLNNFYRYCKIKKNYANNFGLFNLSLSKVTTTRSSPSPSGFNFGRTNCITYISTKNVISEIFKNMGLTNQFYGDYVKSSINQSTGVHKSKNVHVDSTILNETNSDNYLLFRKDSTIGKYYNQLYEECNNGFGPIDRHLTNNICKFTNKIYNYYGDEDYCINFSECTMDRYLQIEHNYLQKYNINLNNNNQILNTVEQLLNNLRLMSLNN